MIWKIKREKTDNIVDQILLNRRIGLGAEKSAFLKPELTDLNDPMLLPDMDKAIEIFSNYQKRKSGKIGIFADYDADGIPGGVLIKELCNQLGLRSLIYIPTREEGYGLSKKAIDYFLDNDVSLMITIDCGVANLNEIDYAKNKDLSVIILDHHETKSKLPAADAVVNAKRKDSKYPFREISGAAVGFKFAQAISKKNKKIDKKFLLWSLDLIGISTISDMVPLVKENRIFAKWGIEVLRQTKRPGLIELYKNAGIEPKKISSYNVGFQIGPRINAPGRMDHANHAFYLLTEKNSIKAKNIADQIEEINNKRQKEIEKIFNQVDEKIEEKSLADNNIILIKNKGWPKGVIGLVASRIVEKYFRPAIILSQEEDYSEGSARAIPKFNILNYLDGQNHLLERYGGHSMAAGLKIRNSNFQQFYDNIIDLANKNLNDVDMLPVLKIDKLINLKQINSKLYSDLTTLEPYGIANPRPVFASKSVEIINYSYVGANRNHLKIVVSDGNKKIPAIGFNLKPDFNLSKVKKVDIAYSLDENNFQGRTSLQLNLKDIKDSNE